MVGIGADFYDDDVLKNYELKRRIGRGLYGLVWKAKIKSYPSSKPVAIKRMFNAFTNRVDAKRTYRELQYLLKFQDHPNIVSVHELLAGQNDGDMYIVMEHVDVDLAGIIPMNLQRIHIEYITWQLLSALKYIHSASVVHRDIKPQNILVNPRCDIRLCDFGMARSVIPNEPDMLGPLPSDYALPKGEFHVELTNYCSSRWYRAPEQLVQARNYSTGIDMWALGCVVGEMIQRKPIFPGTCTLSQLSLIVHLTGRPADHDLAGIRSRHVVPILEGLGNSTQGNLTDLVPNGTLESLDLIHLCLQFNPEKRVTAAEALGHPFVGHFHHPDEEAPHSTFETGGIHLALSDDVQYSVSAYRDRIYAELLGRGSLAAKIKKERLIKENGHRRPEFTTVVVDEFPRPSLFPN